jgi:hypothetical protein
MAVTEKVTVPGLPRPDSQGNGIEQRFRAIPEHANRILRVACLESDREIRTITAFFDRKARRPA